MPELMPDTTPPSTHGCMTCKAPQRYTVEAFTNGNTGWRCAVCRKILRLVPGRYVAPLLQGDAPYASS